MSRRLLAGPAGSGTIQAGGSATGPTAAADTPRGTTVSDPKLPTWEEIRQLPRWARVAFAAHCARRVLPLYAADWPDAPPHRAAAVDQAVRYAEVAATTLVADAAEARGTAADARETAAEAERLGRLVAADIAHAAAAAADAVRAAADAERDVTDATRDTARAAAAAALRAAAAFRDESAGALIRRDFDAVLSHALANGWTAGTAVPPDTFGKTLGVPMPYPAAAAGGVSPLTPAQLGLIQQRLGTPDDTLTGEELRDWVTQAVRATGVARSPGTGATEVAMS